MIVLTRQMTELLVMYKLMVERIDRGHTDYDYVETTYRQMKKGYAGERRADREWQDMHMHLEHMLLHDYTAKNSAGFTHQIDTIFICHHFLVVLELKDIGGSVVCDEEKGEMLQTWSDGTQKIYEHPMYQILRHKAFIEREIGHIVPVIPLVVMTDLSVRIEANTQAVDVIKLKQLRL